MNMWGLRDEFLDKLHWYMDVEDENYDDFSFEVAICVESIREYEKRPPNYRSKSQKRIDKVKKAFDALTDMDKFGLDLGIETNYKFKNFTDVPEIDSKKPSYIRGQYKNISKHSGRKVLTCEKMQWALGRPAVSQRPSLPRKALIDFAQIAVREGWVDVSVNNTNLTALILILMEEACVRHDAVAIANKAVKNSEPLL